MKQKKKLFLLDAYALIYRAYFAFIKNPRINSKGLNTSAVFGFVNTLLEVIKKEKPTHLGVVFDTKEPTIRHIEYPKYKANREAMPEGLQEALPYIDDFLEAMRIPKLYKIGYEADDVIGTLARKAERLGFQVYIMTSDKDFAQLVSKNIFIYRPGNKWNPTEIWREQEVLEKFKINRINQVIDFLGMMGDTVDNIPGIPGIGKKTAQKLLKEFGSMEEVFANTENLKGKIKQNIEEGRELGLLCKKLVTIIIDVPVDFIEEEFILQPKNNQKIKTLFEELEFRTLLNKIFNNNIEGIAQKVEKQNFEKTKQNINEKQMELFSTYEEKQVSEKTFKDNKNYNLILSSAEINTLVKKIIKHDVISIYVCRSSETHFFDQKIIGIALCVRDDKVDYISFNDKNIQNIKLLEPIFQQKEILIIGENIKSYMKLLNKYGIDFSSRLFDVSIAHYLLYTEMRHDLDLIIENLLDTTLISIEQLQGKGKLKQSLEEVDINDLKNYSSVRAEAILKLYVILNKQIKETNTKELFYKIEMPLISVLSSMEIEGVKLDSKILFDLSRELQGSIDKQIKKIYSFAGIEFNIDSPKQLGEVLFEKMKIAKKIKKTKSGQYSTSEETLSTLSNTNPIIESILEYREIKKLLSTYVIALPNLIRKDKIHTTFNQNSVATGRLSSTNPNLQNIPIRTKRGRVIRKAFVSRGGDYSLLSADYSQIELRIIAELSKDREMLRAFNEGKDIHAATAAKVYKVPLEKVDRVMRSRAKSVNFGIIYGISAFGLAQNISSSRKEAKQIIEEYFLQFPKIKEYMDFTISEAREKEYTETIFGRKRYLRDINSRNAVTRGIAERNAINTPIQGSAADIIKKAMIDIHTQIYTKGLKSRMLLQVHDELIFDMHKDEEKVLKAIVKNKMEGVIEWNLPLVVDLGIGKNWLEAH